MWSFVVILCFAFSCVLLFLRHRLRISWSLRHGGRLALDGACKTDVMLLVLVTQAVYWTCDMVGASHAACETDGASDEACNIDSALDGA